MLNLKELSPVFLRGWLKIGFVFALLGWAITVSVFLLRQKPETYLIAVDDSEPRIITEKNDQVLAKERLKMVGRFLYLYYSYDPQNVNDRIDDASKLMSTALWNRELNAVLSQIQKIKSDDTTQSIKQLYGVKEVRPLQFEAEIEIATKSRLKEGSIPVKITLTLEPRPRTTNNPWGYQIVELVEDYQRRSS
jgi:hypothetical protein